ncbi:unnamed protein product [Cyclocybe aegerita]|uniref:Uncharacterized protein n=1 Tax=Cyclocybe aegerita TaxID=1973307 RepID=A0A8S0XPS4_CYCAE|nr:unnamed protein product [Cyclocybe aegerita]
MSTTSVSEIASRRAPKPTVSSITLLAPPAPPSNPTPSSAPPPSAPPPSSSSSGPTPQQAPQKGPLFKVHPSSFFKSPTFDYSIPDSKKATLGHADRIKLSLKLEAAYMAKCGALTKAIRRTAKAEEEYYAKVQHELQVLAHAAEMGQPSTCLDPQNAYDLASATHAVFVSEQKMVKRRVEENELRVKLLKDELKRVKARVKAAERQFNGLLEAFKKEGIPVDDFKSSMQTPAGVGKEDLDEKESEDSDSEMMEGSVEGSDSEDTGMGSQTGSVLDS